MTTKDQISKLMLQAQPEARSAIAAIFRIEKEHAYQARPIRVHEQVREAIREAVK